MNQLEQLREQCAMVVDSFRRRWLSGDGNATFNECRDEIRALPLPEVSNKPVAYIRYRYAQSLEANGHCDGHEWMEICNEGEHGDDGEPAFPVYAVPVPYIPQDIRKTVDENKALRKENEQMKKRIAIMQSMIQNDSLAMTFQTMGQYRTALLKELAK